jgi:methionyl-tRNA formyltransferase
VPQPAEGATLAPKLLKEEGQLSPWRSASEEYNRFRGVTPNPGATLMTAKGPVKVSKARLGTESGDPGVVLGTKGGCEVAFQGGSIVLLEVQPEGKKRISGQDFANGLRLKPGMRLVEPTNEST